MFLEGPKYFEVKFILELLKLKKSKHKKHNCQVLCDSTTVPSKLTLMASFLLVLIKNTKLKPKTTNIKHFSNKITSFQTL